MKYKKGDIVVIVTEREPLLDFDYVHCCKAGDICEVIDANTELINLRCPGCQADGTLYQTVYPEDIELLQRGGCINKCAENISIQEFLLTISDVHFGSRSEAQKIFKAITDKYRVIHKEGE